MGYTVCSRPVSGSFHTPPGVLFNFPSRYLFTIGLGTYLALEVGDSQLPTAMSSRGTLLLGPSPLDFAYGALTLYGGPFQTTSAI